MGKKDKGKTGGLCSQTINTGKVQGTSILYSIPVNLGILYYSPFLGMSPYELILIVAQGIKV